MEIKEIAEKKKDLERDIERLLMKFVEDTGVSIAELIAQRHVATAISGRVLSTAYTVSARIEL